MQFLPTFISLLRIVLTPLFIFLFMRGDSWSLLAAVLVFTLAALTDSCDGYLARRLDAVTTWGAFLDPLADKVLIGGVLGSFWWQGVVAGWVIGLIFVRDIVVTAVRMITMRQGRLIKTTGIAKAKTVAQFVWIYAIFLWMLVARVCTNTLFVGALLRMMELATVVIVILTVYTGLDYVVTWLHVSWIHLFATCCGVGYIPRMPGTAASALTVVGLWFMPVLPVWLNALGLLLVTGAAVWAAGMVARQVGKPDPSIVVIDEVVGMWVATLGLPVVWWVYGLAFLTFRIFDIAKPFPVNYVEKNLPGGWGIVADDAVAGLLARVAVGFVLCSILAR